MEDVEQEARFALERARRTYRAGGKSFVSWAWRCVSAHLAEQVKRERYRRPLFAELTDVHRAPGDLHELVAARAFLRELLEAPLTSLERRAVNGALAGDRYGRDRRDLDNALCRAKRKLLTAA